MQHGKRISWKDLSRLFPANPDEAEKSRSLFIFYEKNGYVNQGELSPGSSGKAVIIDFFYRLSLLRSAESPIHRKKKASWIHERDFTYFNHRILPLIDEFPLFAQLSALPAMRISAVIFAPFTSNRKKEINTVDSHSVICDDFCDSDLLEKGISREEQFHLLIEAVHLLGKCVGYSLDYRVDRFAVPVLRRPDLFRWIDVNSIQSYREMLTEAQQNEIVRKINNIVNDYLGKLSTGPTGEDYNQIRKLLKDAGYWTIPSCCSNSDQLPSYDSSDKGSFPVFRGGDENLTSFKFYMNPGGAVNGAALDYYSSLYIKWRDNFSFDFIKFQGIDYADDEKMRKADCPSLDMIRKVIRKTMGKISHTGIVGSLCKNPETMLASGFNTIFYHDSSFSVDHRFMDRNFNLNTYLLEINRKKRKQLSIVLHGGLYSEDIIRRVFISRFLNCNDSYRPKYEIWNSMTDDRLYNMIENLYTRYREFVRKGQIVKHYTDEKVSWWIVRHGSNLLIPVVSLDNPEEQNPGNLLIDYSDVISSSRVLSVLEYDFTSSGGNLFLCGDDKIHCEDLPYRGFRLFSVQ
ncbi:MAG: hypothetical protein JEY91_13985 [Spirochaetaceae bacterium]|nr:hypothetical protein [Spirochaetaceae bacterium]